MLADPLGPFVPTPGIETLVALAVVHWSVTVSPGLAEDGLAVKLVILGTPCLTATVTLRVAGFPTPPAATISKGGVSLVTVTIFDPLGGTTPPPRVTLFAPVV